MAKYRISTVGPTGSQPLRVASRGPASTPASLLRPRRRFGAVHGMPCIKIGTRSCLPSHAGHSEPPAPLPHQIHGKVPHLIHGVIVLLFRCILSRLFVPAIKGHLPQAVPAGITQYDPPLPQQIRRHPDAVSHIVVGLLYPPAPLPQGLDEAGRRRSTITRWISRPAASRSSISAYSASVFCCPSRRES